MSWPLPDLVQVFDFGGKWTKVTSRLVDDDDAAVMLKRVEGILDDSKKVLESNKERLSQNQYRYFHRKHSSLLLQVVDIKDDIDGQFVKGERSASPSDKQACRTTLIQLYDIARSYKNDVVSASRQAQEDEDEEEECFARAKALEQEIPGDQSLVATPAPAATVGSSSAAPSRSSSTAGWGVLSTGSQYLAVSHSHATARQDLPPGTYRQHLLVQCNNREYLLMDPTLHRDGDNTGENSLIEMSQVVETIAKTDDLDKLEGFTPMELEKEPTWVNSLIQAMSSMSVGVGSKMV